MSEEIVLACLLHDVVQTLIKTDHGWWGAQMFEPYDPEKTSFAHHQTLRFYEDKEAAISIRIYIATCSPSITFRRLISRLITSSSRTTNGIFTRAR